MEDRLRSEAPKLWQAFESRYSTAKGTVRRLAKARDRQGAPLYERVTEFKVINRGACRLVEENRTQGFEGDGSRQYARTSVLGVNDDYAFQIHRAEEDKPWIIDYRGRDVEGRDLLRDQMASIATHYVSTPYSVLNRRLDTFLFENPAVRVVEVTPTEIEREQHARVVFKYDPHSDSKPLKALRGGTVVLDIPKGWVVRSAEFEFQHPNAPGKTSLQITYETASNHPERAVKSIAVSSSGPGGYLDEEITFPDWKFASVADDAFTLAAYGLPGFEKPKRRFHIPLNWVLFGAGSLAIGVAFILRRKALASG